jgi:ketosteroid isomerase-like protein
MALPRPSLALVPLLLACRAAPDADSCTGMYASANGLLELHHGPEGALRGHLRSGDRIAALAPVEIRAGVFHANARYDDDSLADLTGRSSPGPVLVVDGHEYRRTAVEKPADASVRHEIEEAYARLAQAVDTKDFDAFQALRVAHFATIPPDGRPRTAASMAERARGLLERIQPPITTTNDILELTVRGHDAIATVRQEFTRMQPIEGALHEIHTEVTQRETWTRTPDGWKLLFVDEVRDPITLNDGRPMD